MMTGEINNLRAHLTLFVRGAGGQGNVEFTIDTGFTGAITLPPAACAALQLPRISRRFNYLADGSRVRLNIHLLTVSVDGVEKDYEAIALESDPLLGMAFLQGYEVCLRIAENGTVFITPL